MEQVFGADFSGVKVHTDATSDELNQAIQAKAFTTGEDIFFRSGAYEPSSWGGQELLAHELTHVVQQNGGAVQRLQQTERQYPEYFATVTSSRIQRAVIIGTHRTKGGIKEKLTNWSNMGNSNSKKLAYTSE